MSQTGQLSADGQGSTIRLRIESDRQALGPTNELCRRFICQAGFGEDECHWLASAVQEAIANAVIHGNRELPGTYVDIAFELLPGGIRITVVDEGDGFDPESGPDRPSGKHLSSGPRRGLRLMRRFMDEVRFSRPEGGGTAVSMVKALHGPTRDHTACPDRTKGKRDAGRAAGIAPATRP